MGDRTRLDDQFWRDDANPYAAPRSPLEETEPHAEPPPGEVHAALVASSWVYRCLRVTAPEDEYKVEYIGYTMGFESVYVDNEMADSTLSLFWFVPRFEFPVGGRRGVIEIRVWPWLVVRSFTLTIDGRLLYAEGRPATGP